MSGVFGVFPAHRVKSTNAVVRRLFAEFGASFEHVGTGAPVIIGDEAYVLFRNVGPVESAIAACRSPFKVAGDLLRLEPLRISNSLRLELRQGPPPNLTAPDVCQAVFDTEGIELTPAAEDGCFLAASAADAALLCDSAWTMAVCGGETLLGFAPAWEIDEEWGAAAPAPGAVQATAAAPAAPVPVAVVTGPLHPSSHTATGAAAAVGYGAHHALEGHARAPEPVLHASPGIAAPGHVGAAPPPALAPHAWPAAATAPGVAVAAAAAVLAPAPPSAPEAAATAALPRGVCGIGPDDLSAVYILHDASTCPIASPGVAAAALWRSVVRESYAALCGLTDSEAADLDLLRLPTPHWACVTRPAAAPRAAGEEEAEAAAIGGLRASNLRGFEHVALGLKDKSIFAELKTRLVAILDRHRDALEPASPAPPARIGVVVICARPVWFDTQLRQLQDAGFHLGLLHSGNQPPSSEAGPRLSAWQSRAEWDRIVQVAAAPLATRSYSRRMGGGGIGELGAAPPVSALLSIPSVAEVQSNASLARVPESAEASQTLRFHGDSMARVVVSLLPTNCSVESIRAYLAPAGAISAIALSPPHSGGRSSTSRGLRRSAYVAFADAASAEKSCSIFRGVVFPGKERSSDKDVLISRWMTVRDPFPPPSFGPYEYLLLGPTSRSAPRNNARQGREQQQQLQQQQERRVVRKVSNVPASTASSSISSAAAGEKRKRPAEEVAKDTSGDADAWASLMMLPGLQGSS